MQKPSAHDTEVDYSLDSCKVGDTVSQFPKQCHQVIQEISQQQIPSDYSLSENIVVSGMGGSALGGRVIASLERQTIKIPILVSTQYHLPNFVNNKTLVIISSYSGSTDETLASLIEAKARNANIFILTSGGKLGQIAQDEKIPHYIFNPQYNLCNQPRMGLGYSITAMLTILARCQLIFPAIDLGQLPQYLTSRQSTFRDLQVLIKKYLGRIPVIISSEHLIGAAHCFKNQINENAKTFAVSFDLPEINHHLLEGLSFPKSNPNTLAVMTLYSPKYHQELIRRYPLSEEVFKKNQLFVQRLTFDGPNRLFETMEMIQAGSFMAYYLALLNGIDPSPIPWVDWYKHEIRKMV